MPSPRAGSMDAGPRSSPASFTRQTYPGQVDPSQQPSTFTPLPGVSLRRHSLMLPSQKQQQNLGAAAGDLPQPLTPPRVAPSRRQSQLLLLQSCTSEPNFPHSPSSLSPSRRQAQLLGQHGSPESVSSTSPSVSPARRHSIIMMQPPPQQQQQLQQEQQLQPGGSWDFAGVLSGPSSPCYRRSSLSHVRRTDVDTEAADKDVGLPARLQPLSCPLKDASLGGGGLSALPVPRVYPRVGRSFSGTVPLPPGGGGAGGGHFRRASMLCAPAGQLISSISDVETACASLGVSHSCCSGSSVSVDGSASAPLGISDLHSALARHSSMRQMSVGLLGQSGGAAPIAPISGAAALIPPSGVPASLPTVVITSEHQASAPNGNASGGGGGNGSSVESGSSGGRVSVDEPERATAPTVDVSRLKFLEAHGKSTGRLDVLRQSVQERAAGNTVRSLQHSMSISRTPMMPGAPYLSGKERSRVVLDAGPLCGEASEAAVAQSAIMDVAATAVGDIRSDGSPQKIQAHLGVTVRYLHLFAQHIASLNGGGSGPDGLPAWELTTASVMKSFILPKTASLRCKFADLVPKQHIMVPTIFVSHAHAGSFAGMVETVLRFCLNNSMPPATTAVFVDVLCLNPHARGMLPECMAVHRQMVDNCKHLLLVIDHKGLALSRLWCCYEAWLAVLLDRAASKAAAALGPPGNATRVDKLQVMYNMVDMEAVTELYLSLDLSRLAVQEPTDLAAITTFATSQVVGVDSSGLSAMLPALHVAMPQVMHNDYFNAAKSRSRRAARYLDATMQYANTLVLVGQPWEAEKLMRQDLLWSKERNLTSQSMQSLMNNLAVVLKISGFSEEAERLCLEALDKEVDPDTRLPFVDCDELSERLLLVNLEDILFRRADWARAEILAQQLVAAGRDAHKRSHACGAGVLRPLRHLGDILMQQHGAADKAEVLLREGVAIAVVECGEHSVETAWCQYSLGMCLQALGNLVEACDMLQRCIQTRASVLGESHALTLEASVAHAGMLIAHHEYDAAEKVLEPAFNVAQRSLGTRHPVTLKALAHYTTLRDRFMDMGHDSREMHCDHEAEKLLRRALHINTLVWSEAVEQLLLRDLIEVVRQQGKMTEFKVLSQRLLESGA